MFGGSALAFGDQVFMATQTWDSQPVRVQAESELQRPGHGNRSQKPY